MDRRQNELRNAVDLTAEVESRTQGSRPRPKTQKKSEAKAKDQGHKHKCSPKKKKKKKGLHKNFSGDLPKKKSLHKNFSSDLHKKTFSKKFSKRSTKFLIQKIVLSSSRGQANFRGLEASRPRPKTSKSVLEDSIYALQVSFFF